MTHHGRGQCVPNDIFLNCLHIKGNVYVGLARACDGSVIDGEYVSLLFDLQHARVQKSHKGTQRKINTDTKMMYRCHSPYLLCGFGYTPAVYGHLLCVCALVCVCVCALVCACVCVCVYLFGFLCARPRVFAHVCVFDIHASVCAPRCASRRDGGRGPPNCYCAGVWPGDCRWESVLQPGRGRGRGGVCVSCFPVS